ncbi:MAG: hypothetical protein C0467_06130 [Planctomycetaceae bacterium]|nr:hypothetical protein [Planctomycetaceae bacterium]
MSVITMSGKVVVSKHAGDGGYWLVGDTLYVTQKTFDAMRQHQPKPLTTKEALFAAILASPLENTPRLMLADWFDEHDVQQPSPGACEQRLVVALREVITEPDNDEPRLRYATVCEQYGWMERAEFIRLQCEIATLPDYPPGELSMSLPPEEYSRQRLRKLDLENRERELLTEFGPKWYIDFAESVFPYVGCASWSIDGPQPTGWMVCHGVQCVQRIPFVRGFVENFTSMGEDWVRDADRLLSAAPIKRVALTTLDDIGSVESLRVQAAARAHGIDITDPAGVVRAMWPAIKFTFPGEPFGAEWLDDPAHPE